LMRCFSVVFLKNWEKLIILFFSHFFYFFKKKDNAPA
jgi:hypothetical protein